MVIYIGEKREGGKNMEIVNAPNATGINPRGYCNFKTGCGKFTDGCFIHLA